MHKAALLIVAVLFMTGAGAGCWIWFHPTPAYISADRLTEAERLRRSCGPISLAIAAQLSGYQLTPTQLISECQYRVDGVDSPELCRLAARHQFQLSSAEITWKELLDLDVPVLLHYSRGHFVVANPVESDARFPDAIRIYDPNRTARYMGQTELESEWDGHVLIVRRHPAPRTTVDAVAASRWWHDSGAQSKLKGDAIYLISLTNQSAETIHLGVANTSCSCTSATLEHSDLAPGATTGLRAVVALEKKRGPYYERVTVRSVAAGIERDWVVTLAGSAVDEVSFSDKTLHLGEAHPGDELTGSIVVRDRGDRSLVVISATIRSQDSSDQSVFHCQQTLIQEKSLDPGVIRRHPLIVPGDWLIEVSRRPSGKGDYGPIDASLEVEFESDGARSVLTCPVEGKVIPDIAVVPSTLIFRPGTLTREVVVSRTNGGRIDLAGANVEGLDEMACDIIQSRSSTETIVRLTTNAQQTNASKSGKLCIMTADGGEFFVPLIVLP